MKAWQEWATCAQVDPEIWYPQKGGSSRNALSMCRDCAVRIECLADAFVSGTTDGVWGGIPPRPRRTMLQELNRRPEDVEEFAERAIIRYDQLIEEDECAA